MILTEGRNRQIRRMLAACGHKVRRLVRVAISRLELGGLRPGQSRRLTAKEVAELTTRFKD
jgi:pseudouridine synthase